MIKIPLAVVRVAAFCLPLGLLASCGSDSQAVQGTVINFDPPAIGQTTTDVAGISLVEQLFTIELRSPTGLAQINVDLIIDAPSGGTLFAVDTSTVPFTLTPVNPPFLTKTNSNGTYTAALSFAVGVAFTGTVTVIEAFSGTAYNRANVTYVCTETAAAAVCP